MRGWGECNNFEVDLGVNTECACIFNDAKANYNYRNDSYNWVGNKKYAHRTQDVLASQSRSYISKYDGHFGLKVLRLGKTTRPSNLFFLDFRGKRKKIKSRLPDKYNALSTHSSASNLMCAKFFLLILTLVIPPHCSKMSLSISSVSSSGNPPTKTVLQPGGRSRVDGGGAPKKWSWIPL